MPLWSDLDILLRLTPQKDIKIAYDAEAAVNAFLNRLLTTMGERVMRPTFGSRLATLLHEPLTQETAEDIAHEIMDAAADEERIALRSLEVIADTTEGHYEVNMDIEVPQLNRMVSVTRILRHTV